MTRQGDFSEATKRAARRRADGHCECCGLPTGPHNPPEVDHKTELWEGGDNSLSNARCVGRKCCHQKKSAAATTRRAKADAARAYHLDTKPKSRRPMPGGRQSRFKRKISGEVVLR